MKEDYVLLAALETHLIPILTMQLQHEPTVLNHELEGTTTLLTTSFSSSDPAIPKFLLNNGAEPGLGTAAIMEEARPGTANILGCLSKWEQMLTIMEKERGGELLHLVVRDGKVDVVKLLVEKKVDLATVNE